MPKTHDTRRSPDRKPSRRVTISEHLLLPVAVGSTVVGLVVAAPKAITGISHELQRGQAALGAERRSNESGYAIPSAKEPHRILIYGHIYKDREGHEHVLSGIDATAGFINKMAPDIEYGDARDYLMAENAKNSGAEDPLDVANGQGARLPLEFGVGKIFNPDSANQG